MNNTVLTIGDIKRMIKPIATKYKVKEIYLFGSYARGEADFRHTLIFSLAEELRIIFNKEVDVFEINEINKNSDFYNAIMKERLLVA